VGDGRWEGGGGRWEVGSELSRRHLENSLIPNPLGRS
jgi:hypothetical protein